MAHSPLDRFRTSIPPNSLPQLEQTVTRLQATMSLANNDIGPLNRIRKLEEGNARLRGEENDEWDNSSNTARPTPDTISRTSTAPGILYDPPSMPPRPARSDYLVTDYHPTVELGAVRPMKRRKFAGLHSHGSTRTSDDSPPLMVHPVPEFGLDVPACKRLISGALSQQQVIYLIKVIFTSKDEVAMIRDLRGDDAQAFVDTVYEVRSASWALSEASSNHLPSLIRLWISRISNHYYEPDV